MLLAQNQGPLGCRMTWSTSRGHLQVACPKLRQGQGHRARAPWHETQAEGDPVSSSLLEIHIEVHSQTVKPSLPKAVLTGHLACSQSQASPLPRRWPAPPPQAPPCLCCLVPPCSPSFAPCPCESRVCTLDRQEPQGMHSSASGIPLIPIQGFKV